MGRESMCDADVWSYGGLYQGRVRAHRASFGKLYMFDDGSVALQRDMKIVSTSKRREGGY